MRLNLIRHGMTQANEKRLYCGSTDLPLSEGGERNLVLLRESIAYPPAEICITSALRRSAETLRILYHREPDCMMAEWNELDFGDFEMKSYEELKDDPAYQQWIGGGSAAVCPRGESQNVLSLRVASGLRKLPEIAAQDILVVSHGGVIATIMEMLFPGEKHFYEWQPDFGRGYALDLTFGGAAPPGAVVAGEI